MYFVLGWMVMSAHILVVFSLKLEVVFWVGEGSRGEGSFFFFFNTVLHECECVIVYAGVRLRYASLSVQIWMCVSLYNFEF